MYLAVECSNFLWSHGIKKMAMYTIQVFTIIYIIISITIKNLLLYK